MCDEKMAFDGIGSEREFQAVAILKFKCKTACCISDSGVEDTFGRTESL